MKRCRACTKALEIKPPVGRRDVCPFCGADLHCCLNCTFYTPEIYNECRESQAERVMEKDRGNFCDFFVFRNSLPGVEGAEDRAAAKAKRDSLFK
jgi:hypothetical protein